MSGELLSLDELIELGKKAQSWERRSCREYVGCYKEIHITTERWGIYQRDEISYGIRAELNNILLGEYRGKYAVSPTNSDDRKTMNFFHYAESFHQKESKKQKNRQKLLKYARGMLK